MVFGIVGDSRDWDIWLGGMEMFIDSYVLEFHVLFFIRRM